MIVLKLQLGTDIRRVSLESQPSIDALKELANSLYGKSLPKRYVFKYKDEEGDVISVATDAELQEAYRVLGNGVVRFGIVEVNVPVKKEKPAFPVKKEKPAQQKPQAPAANPNDRTLELDIDLGENFGETIQNLISAFTQGYNKSSCENNNTGVAVHHGVTCDGCGASPIQGIRWKCTVCPDFDLCEKCDKAGAHREHPFAKITQPIRRGPCGRRWGGFQADPSAHYGVSCDGCGANPIKGKRFNCAVCENYDLCESCMANGVHSEHNFKTIETPVRRCPWQRFSAPAAAQPTNGKEEVPVPAPVQPEVKPAPVEVKPTEVKPVEIKPVQPAPVEVKPAPVPEVKPVEVKPVEVKPVVEVKPAPVPEVKPVEVKPVEVKPEQPKDDSLAAKLKSLHDMGFTNVQLNVELLKKNNGDLVKTITALLDY